MIARSRSPRGEEESSEVHQLLQAPWGQVPDKTGRTARHHWDRILQPILTQPFRAQEPEERAQRRRRQRHRPRPVAASQAADEADHMLNPDLRRNHRAPGEHRLQKRARVPGVVEPRPRAHVAGAAQMLVERCEHFLQPQPVVSCHQLLLVFRTDRTHKKRRDYVQLRPP
jgi:hypothetical protein